MNRLKSLRALNAEYQEDIAKLLDVAVSTISKYESGDIIIPTDNLIKLADHYGVSTDYLLGRDSEMQIAASTKDKIDLSEISEKDKLTIMQLVESLRNKKND